MTQELKNLRAEALIWLTLISLRTDNDWSNRIGKQDTPSSCWKEYVAHDQSRRRFPMDMMWDLIDRCRTALLERGIRQWDHLYPARESVAADIADKRLYR